MLIRTDSELSVSIFFTSTVFFLFYHILLFNFSIFLQVKLYQENHQRYLSFRTLTVTRLTFTGRRLMMIYTNICIFLNYIDATWNLGSQAYLQRPLARTRYSFSLIQNIFL